MGAIEKDVIRGRPGFSVTRDGRWMVWAQIDHLDSDLMLIEHFR